MGDRSAIEWTDATWNPTRGCTRVSEGCRNCYAETVAARFSDPGQPYEGLATRGPARWTGEVRLLRDRLLRPLSWRKPQRIFVDSMSDLFHPAVPFDFVDEVFATMALSLRHTYQILTKRPERMLEYLTDRPFTAQRSELVATLMDATSGESLRGGRDTAAVWSGKLWPLPNVWLGVSVEDQATADARVPLLLRTPAALRFVSYEPALGPVDFTHMDTEVAGSRDTWWVNALTGKHTDMGRPCDPLPHLDWVIVGGESGPGARPFDVAWARSTIAQCREAGVAVFCKQLGSKPRTTDGDQLDWPVRAGFDDVAFPPQRAGLAPGGGQWWTVPTVSDRKGGDMEEWSPDIRVREFPAVRDA